MATATTAGTRPRLGGFDPFKAAYRFLTSVRIAIIQLVIVAVACLFGVVFPQAPAEVRLNPAAYETWMEPQRERYGPFAEWMRRADLFEVFRSYWFNGLLILLLLSVAVCTANRWGPIWRSTRRPVRRPNDRYFETAHHRTSFATPVDADTVAAELRRQRYKVSTVAEAGAVRYLFADRYAWAHFATFATHLSLILFMAGGIVSKLNGYENFIQVGEGFTQPVFPVLHSRQMQVLNQDSIEGRDAAGNVIDYRTHIVVYQNGAERCAGDITVNGPLDCEGFRFHQGTYAANGVALTVKDASTGQTLLAEAPVLQDNPGLPSPRLVVTSALGERIMDQFLTLSPFDPEEGRFLQIFPMPDSGRPYAVSVLTADPTAITILYAGDGTSAPLNLTLRPGESAQGGGYRFEYPEYRVNPFLVTPGIPGLEQAALLQLGVLPDGREYLDLQNMGDPSSDTARILLEEGQPVTVGNLEFTYGGRREYTGILVKRDPGSWIIWVATTLMIIGLIITFYVPRRRLWVRVGPERTVIAGLAERTANLGDELDRLSARITGRTHPPSDDAPPPDKDAPPAGV